MRSLGWTLVLFVTLTLGWNGLVWAGPDKTTGGEQTASSQESDQGKEADAVKSESQVPEATAAEATEAQATKESSPEESLSDESAPESGAPDSETPESETPEKGTPESDAQNGEDVVPGEDENAFVENGLDEAEKEVNLAGDSSAEDLLNLATDLKLSATSVFDLTKVIMYCTRAESKGLPDESQEFCHQLKVSTQLQRGLAIAKFFMAGDDTVWESRHGWQLQRKMALEDLEAAVADMPDVAAAQLAIGRLQMLPDGDQDAARDALDQAIELSQEEPAILTESLKYRARLEDDPNKQLEYYLRAQELAPDNPRVLGLLASHWLSVKNYAKALDCIEKALESEPDNTEFKKTKAFILAASDRKDEAIKLFDEILKNNEDDIMLQIEKGQFLLAMHEENQAVEHFTKLIARYPQLPGLYYFRAVCHAQMKEFKKAHKDVNQSLRLDLEFMEAQQLKAVLFLQEEKYDDAIRLFESLCRKQPDSVDPVCQLAYAWAKKGDKDKAFEILNEKLEADPDDMDLLRTQGDIELMYGLWQETIATYDHMMELNPNDSGVLNNYSWLLATSPEDSVRDGKRALEYALRAAELTWYAEAHILSTLAAAYAETGDFDKALEWSTKGVEIATREKNDRLEDLVKEPESYREKKPWREVPEMLRKSQEKDK